MPVSLLCVSDSYDSSAIDPTSPVARMTTMMQQRHPSFPNRNALHLAQNQVELASYGVHYILLLPLHTGHPLVKYHSLRHNGCNYC